MSTERQAGERVTSIADQRAAIEALAARLGVAVGRWYVDEGASGSTVAKRPAFRRLLADCAADPRLASAPGFVLCLNDSRFGRFPDPDQAAAIRYQLSECGWIVRFAEADEVEDVTFRSVIRALGSAQASEYRRNIQRNAKRGAVGTTGQGYWCGRAPFGYRRAVVHPADRARVLPLGVPKAADEKIVLALGPDTEVAAVRAAFAAYAAGTGTGRTLQTLAAAMRAHGPSPSGRAWTSHALKMLLRNPAYVGDVVWGRRTNDATERAQRGTGRRPASAWYGHRDAHPALVDRATFAQVAARLTANAAAPRQAAGLAPLSGLIACGTCGAPLTSAGASTKRRADGTVTRHASYRCARSGGSSRAQATGACAAPTYVAQHGLHAAVVDILRHEVAHTAVRAMHPRTLAAQLAADAAPRSAPPSAATVRLLTAKRDRLVAAVADGTITRAEAEATLGDIRRALDTARAADKVRALSAADRASAVAARAAERARCLRLIDAFPAVAARATGPELRALVLPWLDSGTYHTPTRRLTLMVRQLPAPSPASGPLSGGSEGTPRAGTSAPTTCRTRAPACPR